MRLLIIRHADPDYIKDSITPQGRREAGLLAEYLEKLNIKDIYCSPLGRARHTADVYLEKTGRSAETIDWLREFDASCKRPDKDGESIVWDWLPGDWTVHEEFYDRTRWAQGPALAGTDTAKKAQAVAEGLDGILASHGYKRNGMIYEAQRPNNDTIAFFCHFGVECVMLAHLIGASPMVLWHGTAAAPSSITSVYTEERRRGIASFRISAFGDTSHLAQVGETPSFSARFCECFDNLDERHD